MNRIEVSVIHEANSNPAGMMMFLARLTQKGSSISNTDELLELLEYSNKHYKGARRIAGLPHGTIKRFSPITIAIVGASRRFLAQARTNQVGFTYVSASLQYSKYHKDAAFVIPYSLMGIDRGHHRKVYLEHCEASRKAYSEIMELTDNDTAGYAMAQGLRNVLIMQGNHEAWEHFIQLRTCNRNTVETQYVATLIWNALLNTEQGKTLFAYAGPYCVQGRCREGSMSCKRMLMDEKALNYMNKNLCTMPEAVAATKWPLLKEDWQDG